MALKAAVLKLKGDILPRFRLPLLGVVVAAAALGCGTTALEGAATTSTMAVTKTGAETLVLTGSFTRATRAQLRVGQALVVKVDPRALSWGGDQYSPEVLQADPPCEATCNTSTRTFTAVGAGTATILTQGNCNQNRHPGNAACVFGPRLDVLVTRATDSGTAVGELLVEGGLPQRQGGMFRPPPARPIPGTVRFNQNGHEVATVTVGASGRFSLGLPPGTYSVQACTPSIQEVLPNGGRLDTCWGHVQAELHPGETTSLSVPPFIVP